MKIDWSEPGLPLSVTAHAVVLVASLIGLSSARPFADGEETLPVEIITADQFNAMTKGERTAKDVQPTPKPRIDKVAEIEQLKPTQGTDQTDVPTPPARAPEISDATSAPPLPPTRPPDPVKPEPKPEPQKAVEPQKPEPPKLDAEIPKPPEKPQPQKVGKDPRDAEGSREAETSTAAVRQDRPASRAEEARGAAKARKTAGEGEGRAELFRRARSRNCSISKEKPQASGSIGAQLQKTASLGTADRRRSQAFAFDERRVGRTIEGPGAKVLRYSARNGRDQDSASASTCGLQPRRQPGRAPAGRELILRSRCARGGGRACNARSCAARPIASRRNSFPPSTIGRIRSSPLQNLLG